MIEWLLSPIDPSRIHDVGAFVSWHARAMTLAWVILVPLAVFAARYLKVMPGQDWPRVLDNPFWWRLHLRAQTSVVVLSAIGLVLILAVAGQHSFHGQLGFVLLTALAVQIVLGLMRGSKGGPTAPAPDGSLRGDHYDMTRRRVIFEYLHKTLGYAMLGLSILIIPMGLWLANAPRWMWLLIGVWWVLLLAGAAIAQRRGLALDTYQAIWGPDPMHPGNQRAPIGWGIRRVSGKVTDVRSD